MDYSPHDPKRSDSIDSSRIGWAFISQYYTYLNRDPSQLHCFYTKRSTFIHGTEGAESAPCYGQTEIHNKIMSLAFEDCKVYISNVDCQSSADSGILVQVIGELSNRGGPWRKFVQTFFLAEQHAGYFVLNDVRRFIKDEGEEEVEEEEANAAEVEMSMQASKNQVTYDTLSTQIVDPFPNDLAIDSYSLDALTPVQALVSSLPNGTSSSHSHHNHHHHSHSYHHATADPYAHLQNQDAPPSPISLPDSPKPTTELESIVEAPIESPIIEAASESVAIKEKERVARPVSPIAIRNPIPIVAPSKKAQPPTSAPAVAVQVQATPAASTSSLPPPSTPLAAPTPVTTPLTTPGVVTPKVPTPAPLMSWSIAASKKPKPSLNASSAPATTLSSAASSYPRAVLLPAVLAVSTPACYIKGVVETVSHAALLNLLVTRYGPVKELEIIRPKACAFVTFEKVDGARRAIQASMRQQEGGEGGITIDGDSMHIVTKAPAGQRPTPGGTRPPRGAEKASGGKPSSSTGGAGQGSNGPATPRENKGAAGDEGGKAGAPGSNVSKAARKKANAAAAALAGGGAGTSK